MISLDEPHLRFQALSILLARLEQDDLDAARDAQLVGLDEPLFQRLRSLPAAELARLSAIKHLKVSIVVDGGHAAAKPRHYGTQSDRRALPGQ